MSQVITIHYGYDNKLRHQMSALSFFLPAIMPSDEIEGALDPEAYAFSIAQRLRRACDRDEVAPAHALGSFIPDQVGMPAAYTWNLRSGDPNCYDSREMGDHSWCYLADVSIDAVDFSDDAACERLATHRDGYRIEPLVERFEAMRGQWQPFDPEANLEEWERALKASEIQPKPLVGDRSPKAESADVAERIRALGDRLSAFGQQHQGARIAGLAARIEAVTVDADAWAKFCDEPAPR